MKKFDPEKELNKIQSQSFNKKSNFNGMFLPLLVIGCSVLAMASASFSANIVGTTPIHKIELDIVNGPIDSYYKEVTNGPFEDVLNTDATFGSIKCSSGSLEYDTVTHKIYNNDVRSDITCLVYFIDDGTKNISLAELNSTKDLFGRTYYYKGDSQNNYLKLNDKMFRIIRVNGDGSLRIISETTYKKASFSRKLIEELNEWSKQFENQKVKLSNVEFDTSNYTLDELTLDNLYPALQEYYNTAGLLSVKEAMLINKNVDHSYLGDMLLLNYSDLDYIWSIKHGEITTINKHTTMDIKPVINVKINNLKGQGTKEMPYEVE